MQFGDFATGLTVELAIDHEFHNAGTRTECSSSDGRAGNFLGLHAIRKVTGRYLQLAIDSNHFHWPAEAPERGSHRERLLQ